LRPIGTAWFIVSLVLALAGCDDPHHGFRATDQGGTIAVYVRATHLEARGNYITGAQPGANVYLTIVGTYGGDYLATDYPRSSPLGGRGTAYFSTASGCCARPLLASVTDRTEPNSISFGATIGVDEGDFNPDGSRRVHNVFINNVVTFPVDTNEYVKLRDLGIEHHPAIASLTRDFFGNAFVARLRLATAAEIHRMAPIAARGLPPKLY